MQKDITYGLNEALNETIKLLGSFSDSEINTVPFERSWTAAQVGDHLLKAQTGMDKLFSGPAKPADRAPDENAAGLKNMFLDFTTKMESPEFILPDKDKYDKKTLIRSLDNIRAKVVEAVNAADLTQIPPLPDDNPFKEHTKLELAHFMTYHSQRHNHQLRNIIIRFNS